jgi:hypothetical protein
LKRRALHPNLSAARQRLHQGTENLTQSRTGNRTKTDLNMQVDPVSCPSVPLF